MSMGLILQRAEIDRENRDDLGRGGPNNDAGEAVSLHTSLLPVLGLPGGVRAAGVALCATEGSEDHLEIRIVDADGSAALRLGPFPEDEVIATWRRLGAESGLPLLLVDEAGRLVTAQAKLGRVQLGSVRTRRGHGLLNGRRPRFLLRRKTTRLALRPRIHRGERVIAAGAQG